MPEEGIRSRVGVTGSCEHLLYVLGTELGSLEEQLQVFLVTELAL